MPVGGFARCAPDAIALRPWSSRQRLYPARRDKVLAEGLVMGSAGVVLVLVDAAVLVIVVATLIFSWELQLILFGTPFSLPTFCVTPPLKMPDVLSSYPTITTILTKHGDMPAPARTLDDRPRGGDRLSEHSSETGETGHAGAASSGAVGRRKRHHASSASTSSLHLSTSTEGSRSSMYRYSNKESGDTSKFSSLGRQSTTT